MTPTKPKILLIDDDKQLTAAFASFLREAGYVALVAHDPMQGLMFAQRETPALILLDMMMPAGGGMGLFDKLARSPKTQAIPVLVVTATTDLKTEREAREHGAVGVLHKPVDREVLLQNVKELLDAADE
ncbi:MAG TPA: response regulator [Gemmatimonadales bacterium]|nr:response regulator [Gemmatimonadales bacterium]